MDGPTRKSQELLEEISRLKQTIAEMKLEQQKDRAQKAGEALLTYLDNAPDGAYMIDSRGTFLYGNKKSEEVIGYTRDELVGKNLLEMNMLTEKSRKKVRELLQIKRKGRPTGPDELGLINKEGRTVHIEIRTGVVEYMGKKVVLGFVRDVTERIEAREEIAREKERLKVLSDSAPFVLVVIDREGRFTYVNARFKSRHPRRSA